MSEQEQPEPDDDAIVEELFARVVGHRVARPLVPLGHWERLDEELRSAPEVTDEGPDLPLMF